MKYLILYLMLLFGQIFAVDYCPYDKSKNLLLAEKPASSVEADVIKSVYFQNENGVECIMTSVSSYDGKRYAGRSFLTGNKTDKFKIRYLLKNGTNLYLLNGTHYLDGSGNRIGKEFNNGFFDLNLDLYLSNKARLNINYDASLFGPIYYPSNCSRLRRSNIGYRVHLKNPFNNLGSFYTNNNNYDIDFSDGKPYLMGHYNGWCNNKENVGAQLQQEITKDGSPSEYWVYEFDTPSPNSFKFYTNDSPEGGWLDFTNINSDGTRWGVSIGDHAGIDFEINDYFSGGKKDVYITWTSAYDNNVRIRKPIVSSTPPNDYDGTYDKLTIDYSPYVSGVFVSLSDIDRAYGMSGVESFRFDNVVGEKLLVKVGLNKYAKVYINNSLRKTVISDYELLIDQSLKNATIRIEGASSQTYTLYSTKGSNAYPSVSVTIPNDDGYLIKNNDRYHIGEITYKETGAVIYGGSRPFDLWLEPALFIADINVEMNPDIKVITGANGKLKVKRGTTEEIINESKTISFPVTLKTDIEVTPIPNAGFRTSSLVIHNLITNTSVKYKKEEFENAKKYIRSVVDPLDITVSFERIKYTVKKTSIEDYLGFQTNPNGLIFPIVVEVGEAVEFKVISKLNTYIESVQIIKTDLWGNEISKENFPLEHDRIQDFIFPMVISNIHVKLIAKKIYAIEVASSETKAYYSTGSKLLQTIQINGDEDIVTGNHLDGIGRVKRTSLPIAKDMMAVNGRHGFVPNLISSETPCTVNWALTLLDEYYGNLNQNCTTSSASKGENAKGYPFTETQFDADGLGRINKQASPGSAWKVSGAHTVRTVYGSEAINDEDYFTKTVTDAQGDVTIEYTDKLGRIVKKKSPNNIITDYVYDGNGNLINIVSPDGPNGQPQVTTMSYDALGRLTNEKLPDQEFNNIHYYDKQGRPRFIARRTWNSGNIASYIKYDKLGRVVERGTFTPSDFSTLEANAKIANYPDPSIVSSTKVFEKLYYDECVAIDDACANHNAVTIILVARENSVAPAYYFPNLTSAFQGLGAIARSTSGSSQSSIKVYQVHQSGDEITPQMYVYEAIKAQNGQKVPVEIIPILKGVTLTSLETQAAREQLNVLNNRFVRGRLARREVFNPNLIGYGAIVESYDYDKYGNTIQVRQVNPNVSEVDQKSIDIFTEYDFQNRATKRKITNAYGTNILHTENFIYDDLGRLVQILDENGVKLLKNEYNSIGQLVGAKSYGDQSNNYLNHEFDYHLHGQLKKIKATQSGLTSLYDLTLQFENTTTNPRFDGLVAVKDENYHNIWGDFKRGYEYDALKRLTATDILSGTNASKLQARYSYYDNGTIRKQVRNGVASINNYNYYSGTNRLKRLSATVEVGIPNTRDAAENYVYDSRGNMIEDKSKNLTVTYDKYDMPYSFSITDGANLAMAYDGQSRIHKKETFTVAGEAKEHSTFYRLGGVEQRYIESDNADLFISIAGGAGRLSIKADGSKFYEFYIKDYLGSTVKTVQPQNNQTTWTARYHDYGKIADRIEAGSGDVTEKFTGKEHDESLALDYFGARYYDNDVAVWTSVDKARQFHNPYSYGEPINSIDGDGNFKIRKVSNGTNHDYNPETGEMERTRSFSYQIQTNTIAQQVSSTGASGAMGKMLGAVSGIVKVFNTVLTKGKSLFTSNTSALRTKNPLVENRIDTQLMEDFGPDFIGTNTNPKNLTHGEMSDIVNTTKGYDDGASVKSVSTIDSELK